jgi:hypothetical protein
MNEKKAIERALQTEEGMQQRQQLLKRLWRLNQREKSVESLSGASKQTKAPASGETTKRPDATKAASPCAPAVA